MSRTFELFQLASVRMSPQHVRTPFSGRQVERFLFKSQIWEDTATVQTMCVPVRTLSFIRQVVNTNFNRPDFILHGPDAQASCTEIVCISATVRTSAFRVRTLKALIWKLCIAKVQPSGR